MSGVLAFGRVGLKRFSVAAAPAQVVAFSTQSSLASLPVMVERARDASGRLFGLGGAGPAAGGGGVPPDQSGRQSGRLSLCRPPVRRAPEPAHGVLFAVGGAPWQCPPIAVSVASVGLPGQVSFFASIAPICLAMGLPRSASCRCCCAVEVVPDIDILRRRQRHRRPRRAPPASSSGRDEARMTDRARRRGDLIFIT
jgi:proton glutamate symport protein